MSSPTLRLPIARLRGHRHLLTGSAVVVVGAAVQALGGAVFWLIAAHLDSEVDVGGAGKLFTSVLFVTYLAGLGLPVALARYAADPDRDSDAVFTWAVIATSAAALVFATAYILVVPSDTTKILFDVGSGAGVALFALFVVGAALSMIVDVKFMTARRWNLIVVRIGVVSLCRFPLLFLLRDSSHRALWLFVLAAGPMAISGFLLAATAPRITGRRHRLLRPSTTPALVRYSSVNYLSTLAYQAPYYALPVIVLTNVTAAAYASFNVAWGIVAVAFYVPTALGQALLAEGGREGAHVRAQVKVAMGMALVLMVSGALLAKVGAGAVEAFYGPEYAAASRVLPVMVAAGIPWAITSLLLSEVRILHRHVATVAITGSLSLFIIIPALVLVPENGIDGASEAWVIGNIVACFVAVGCVAVHDLLHRHEIDPSLSDPDVAMDAAEVGISMAEHTTG